MAEVLPFRKPEDEPDDAPPALTPLAHIVRRSFDTMQRHRTSTGIDARLDRAIRAYEGRYDPEKLAMIRRMKGSEVFMRVTASKCRGASALLRDVYLGADRPWTVNATPVPKLRDDIKGAIAQLVEQEAVAGGPAVRALIPQRMEMLRIEAERVARRKAKEDAENATRKLDDLLVEGHFYEALGAFLTDVTIYPYAVLKGPVVETKLDVVWEEGEAKEIERPYLVWRRVSPYDLWNSPGVERISDGDTAERVMIPRHRLASMRNVPGWRSDVIEEILLDNDRGTRKRSWFFGYEQNRKDRENRDWDEDPNMFDLLCWYGWVQGSVLIDDGAKAEELGVESLDPSGQYMCEVWLASDDVLRAKILPWPAPSPPYFVTSYEKVPGSIQGHGVPDILFDVQDILNATGRSLVNNMGLASGPQVSVNVDLLMPGEDLTALFPWRIWPISGQPGQGDPVKFFQPNSNAGELLGVYKEFMNIADELSAIPRYMTGGGATGGAGRTSSGLAMLMTNASKGLQQVASNIDNDIIAPNLRRLYDVLMLTDVEGILRGDEELVARGVAGAAQLETQRMRQIEFLQATANPIDLQITGLEGRAAILREVADGTGIDPDQVVPDSAEMKSRSAQMAGPPQPGGNGVGPGGGPPQPAPATDTGPRLNGVS